MDRELSMNRCSDRPRASPLCRAPRKGRRGVELYSGGYVFKVRVIGYRRSMRLRKSQGNAPRGFLDGQMLIAMPAMHEEPFARSLIYVFAHSSEGAMGIVVNQPAQNINFPDLLVQLEVIPAADVIQLPPRAGAVRVLKGGPVETGHGF